MIRSRLILRETIREKRPRGRRSREHASNIYAFVDGALYRLERQSFRTERGQILDDTIALAP